MKEIKKGRYSFLVCMLSMLVCAFMVSGIAFGLDGDGGAPAANNDSSTTVASPSDSGESAAENSDSVTENSESATDSSESVAENDGVVSPPESADNDPAEIEGDDADTPLAGDADSDVSQPDGELTGTEDDADAPLNVDVEGDTTEPENNVAAPAPMLLDVVGTAATVGTWDFSLEAGTTVDYDYQSSGTFTFATPSNQAFSSLDKGYVSSMITLGGGAYSGETVPAAWVSMAGRKINVTIPADTLAPSTTYTITVSKLLETGTAPKTTCQSGQDFVQEFTTMDVPLVTTKINPVFLSPAENNYCGFETSAAIEIGFAEEIDPDTIDESLVTLGLITGGGGGGSSDTPVAVTQRWNHDNTLLTIEPEAALDSGCRYRVKVSVGLKTLSGADVNAAELNFTTAALSVQNVSSSKFSRTAGNYQISFDVLNNSSNAKAVDGTIIVRGGKGARDDQGGYVFTAIDFTKGTVTASGSVQVSEEITIEDEVLDNIYVEVYLWYDAAHKYIDAVPFHQIIEVID